MFQCRWVKKCEHQLQLANKSLSSSLYQQHIHCSKDHIHYESQKMNKHTSFSNLSAVSCRTEATAAVCFPVCNKKNPRLTVSGQAQDIPTSTCNCQVIPKSSPVADQLSAFSALTLLVWHQEEHEACKNWVMRCRCGYLSATKCRLLAYGQADTTASQNPIISCLI